MNYNMWQTRTWKVSSVATGIQGLGTNDLIHFALKSSTIEFDKIVKPDKTERIGEDWNNVVCAGSGKKALGTTALSGHNFYIECSGTGTDLTLTARPRVDSAKPEDSPGGGVCWTAEDQP